jgi:hypothetical protein
VSTPPGCANSRGGTSFGLFYHMLTGVSSLSSLDQAQNQPPEPREEEKQALPPLRCSLPGCERPLKPENAVIYIADGTSHYYHATCARSAASELGALALKAVNRDRVHALTTRVDAMERRWEKRGQTKAEWQARVRESLTQLPRLSEPLEERE